MINARLLRQRQTVVTTTLPMWGVIKQLRGLAGHRIVSRLAEMCTWVEVTGDDFRLTRGGKMAITRRFRRLKMAELFGHKLKKATLLQLLRISPNTEETASDLRGKVVYMHKRYIVIQLRVPKARQPIL